MQPTDTLSPSPQQPQPTATGTTWAWEPGGWDRDGEVAQWPWQAGLRQADLSTAQGLGVPRPSGHRGDQVRMGMEIPSQQAPQLQ